MCVYVAHPTYASHTSTIYGHHSPYTCSEVPVIPGVIATRSNPLPGNSVPLIIPYNEFDVDIKLLYREKSEFTLAALVVNWLFVSASLRDQNVKRGGQAIYEPNDTLTVL